MIKVDPLSYGIYRVEIKGDELGLLCAVAEAA